MSQTNDPSAIDQLLDLLIDALEERRHVREHSAEARPTAPIVESTAQPAEPIASVSNPLPASWKRVLKVSHVEDVTPAHIRHLQSYKPRMLRQLTRAIALNLTDDSLLALPSKLQTQLPRNVSNIVAERRRTIGPQPAAVVEPPTMAKSSEPFAEKEPSIEPTAEVDANEAVTVPVESTVVISPIVTAPPVNDNMAKTVKRMLLVLLAVIALANIPFNTQWLNNFVGTNGGDAGQRVINARDGMLLQGSGNPIYLVENNQLRWITTPEAFNLYGYRWSAVRRVSDDYLAQFEQGRPIYLILKCPGSPHIFAFDVSSAGGSIRRWISDIDTFESMGLTWDQVDQSHCNMLRRTPNGRSFPPDAGPAPQP